MGMWSVIQGLEALSQNPQRTDVGYYFACLKAVTSWLDLFLRPCLPSAETILCPRREDSRGLEEDGLESCMVVMVCSKRYPSCKGMVGFQLDGGKEPQEAAGT